MGRPRHLWAPPDPQALYPTVIFIRVCLCSGLLWLYFRSGDRLFLTLLGIVGLGLVLTITGYSLDKRRAQPAAA